MSEEADFAANSSKDCGKWELEPPPLSELASIIDVGLRSNFATSACTVAPCADLCAPPYDLCAGGLRGAELVVDVAGPGNLVPVVRKRIYDVAHVCHAVCEPAERHRDKAVIGPGAGPHHVVGVNAEGMFNCRVRLAATAAESTMVECKTRIAKLDEQRNACVEIIDSPRFSLMANLYVSDGERGDVLHVTASKRTGPLNLPDAIRTALYNAYGDSKHIAMGGVFLLKSGKARLHIMPDFPACHFSGMAEVETWLSFFEMDAPLTCLTVFHSKQMSGVNLREEHTHCYSSHGHAGHYHYDTTPDTVEYEAWLMPAARLHRIDMV